mgnify:CR=1 FL=1
MAKQSGWAVFGKVLAGVAGVAVVGLAAAADVEAEARMRADLDRVDGSRRSRRAAAEAARLEARREAVFVQHGRRPWEEKAATPTAAPAPAPRKGWLLKDWIPSAVARAEDALLETEHLLNGRGAALMMAMHYDIDRVNSGQYTKVCLMREENRQKVLVARMRRVA